MKSKILFTLISIFLFTTLKGQDCQLIELSIANVSCNGYSDGKIVLDHTTSCAPPVTYSWANGASGSGIYNLSPGLYELTLTDASGFQIEKNWYISEPDPIDIDASLYNISCTGLADGSIYLSVLGGTYPFDYEWSNGATDSYIFDAPAGNYTVTVTDDNWCTSSATFTISEPDPVTIQVELFEDISCPGQNDGHIVVEGMGGTTDSGTSMVDYYYEWSTGVVDVNEINNLSPGFYTVTVTDFNFCSASMSYSINDPSQIFVTFPMVTDLTCYGDNSGSIEINASGGTGTLTYNWSNGASGNIIDNLQAGSYTLTITDANGCTFTDTYNVSEPTEIIVTNPIITDVDCFGNENGSIEINPTGGTTTGTSNYTYAWSNGSNSNVISGISGGSYTFTITDANGCTYTDTYNVFEPSPISVTNPIITDVDCFGNENGSIEINPTGGTTTGTSNYTYAWSNGSNSNVISGISGGSYTFTITDANGCTYTDTYNVFEPSPISVTNPIITDVDCFGNENGSIEINPTGGTTTGTTDYTFAWSNGSNSNVISGISGGSYSLTITDANGCTFTDTYNVFEPSQISVTNPIITDVDCFGNENGSIEINPNGGTADYTYAWSNGSNSNVISGISGGSYTFTITDANGCTYTDTYNVFEPSPISVTNPIIADVDCFGNENGSIEINPTGGTTTGTTDYTFAWSNGSNSNVISSISGGSYSLTITDANGCTFTDTYNVFEPSPISVTNPIIADVDCFGNENGSIEINPTGGTTTGTTDYTFAWSNGSNSNVISGISGGSYSLTITDANGCTFTDTYNVFEPSPISVTNPIISDVDCFGNENGSIEINPTGGTTTGTTDYTFAWSNGSNSNVISSISGGSYTLTITDANGCTFTDTYNVFEPSQITIANQDINNVDCYGNENGSIEIEISGGSIGYQYLWSSGATSNTISNASADTYSVTITDSNGCTLVETFTISQPDQIIANADIIDVECGSGDTGSITLNMTGGVGDFSFEWSNGATSNTITNLASGNYSVIVTDGDGCIFNGTYFVAQPGDINIDSANTENNICPEDESGYINLEVSGGFGTLSYNWSNGMTSPSISNLSTGIYAVTISDENECNLVEEYEITGPSIIQANALFIDPVLCPGGEDGQISFVPVGGTSPFLVEWTYYPAGGGQVNIYESANVTDTVSHLFGSGDVQIKISDANSCITELSTINIGEPVELSYTTPMVDDVKCNGENSGLISFSIAGGSSPYAVEWTYVPQSGGENTIEWTYNIDDTVSYNFGAGTISPKVIDANGCILEIETLNINEFAPITNSIPNVIPPLCAGDTTGQVSFNVNGGNSPYSVEWTYTPQNGGEAYIEWTYNVTDLVSNSFPAGIVNSQVTDANGCKMDIDPITISEPAPIAYVSLITADALCYGDSSGMVSFEIIGGQAPYALEFEYSSIDGSSPIYTYENSQSGSINKHFAAGTINIFIEDKNGCFFDMPTQFINVKNEIVVDQFEVIQPLCGEDSSGIVTILLSGGASPYAIEWTYTPSDGGETFVEWTYNINGLEKFYFSPGSLEIYIEDANGCSVNMDEILLENISGPQIEEIKVTYNEGLGNIELILDTTPENITFLWSGPDGFASTEQNLTDLKSGIYNCTVTDKEGCQTLTGNIDVIITNINEINNSNQLSINTLSNGLLSIKTKDERDYRMLCFDINGQRLLQQELNKGENLVDISFLPTGIYIIILQQGSESFSQLISKF